MAKNYVYEGDVIDWTNGTGSAVSSGDPVAIGNKRMGIASVDIANGATGSVEACGVYTLKKNNTVAIADGAKVWWDAANKEIIAVPVLNAWFIGYAVGSSLAAATAIKVKLATFADEGPRTLTLAATGAQTLNVGDLAGGDLILFVPNTAAKTINIASVGSIPPGSKLFVRKTDATAAAITLDPAGSEQIAGGATHATIDANNDFAQFVSNGTAWLLQHSIIA